MSREARRMEQLTRDTLTEPAAVEVEPRTIQHIVVTRGDVDLEPVWDAIAYGRPEHFKEGVTWDNSKSAFDAMVFGRFLAGGLLPSEALVYAQDDDCTVEGWAGLYEAWEPGKIVCNMNADFQKAYARRRSRLLGHGSVFEAGLIRPTFDRYFRHFPMDDLFLKECDRIFTGLNTDRCIMIDVGHVDREFASNLDRMWRQPDHRTRHDEAEWRIDHVLRKEAEAAK